MKIRTILAGTAFASLALAADMGLTGGFLSVPQAQAQASVSISVFYDELANDGDWVRHRDAYVFIPANVKAGWKPYTDGRWVFAEGIGWTWASNERFGWATYHYGRWGYADEIGWHWVPGTRWAPAWVSWRRSNDHVVWAPLPPSRGNRDDADIDVSIAVEDIPAFFWVAVPARQFLEPNIRTVVIRDDRETRRVVQRAEFIGTVRIQNNIVVNTVIDIRVIERDTGQKVRRIEARRTDNPREARATEGQVVMFEGEVRRERDATPPRVREVSEVRKITRERASDEDTARGEGTGTAETAGDTPEAEGNTRPRRRHQATEGGEASENDGETTPATPKRQRRNAEGATPDDGSAGANAETEEATPRQQRRRQRAQDNAADQPAATRDAAEQEEAPAKKRPRRAAEGADNDAEATGSTSASPKAGGDGQNRAGDRAQRRNQQDCDPAADPNCQPNR